MTMNALHTDMNQKCNFLQFSVNTLAVGNFELQVLGGFFSSLINFKGSNLK